WHAAAHEDPVVDLKHIKRAGQAQQVNHAGNQCQDWNNAAKAAESRPDLILLPAFVIPRSHSAPPCLNAITLNPDRLDSACAFEASSAQAYDTAFNFSISRGRCRSAGKPRPAPSDSSFDGPNLRPETSCHRTVHAAVVLKSTITRKRRRRSATA